MNNYDEINLENQNTDQQPAAVAPSPGNAEQLPHRTIRDVILNAGQEEWEKPDDPDFLREVLNEQPGAVPPMELNDDELFCTHCLLGKAVHRRDSVGVADWRFYRFATDPHFNRDTAGSNRAEVGAVWST